MVQQGTACRYPASLTSYFILIPVYHIVWIIWQPFQAAIIQPQDLDQCTALKTPITVMYYTIFVVVMPSTIGMSSIPFPF